MARNDSSTKETFPLAWERETDWLVEAISIDKDLANEPENQRTMDWLGRLQGFALVTNTRMLAVPSGSGEYNDYYELWFSFDSAQNKEHFLELVKRDGLADPHDSFSFKPPLAGFGPRLRDLRPVDKVVPSQYPRQMELQAVVTMKELALKTTRYA
jgi:hypothetical protein